MPILLVAFGGAAGAVTRFVLDAFVTERLGGAFPFGTLVINVSGSFVIGLLFALAVERAVLPAGIRAPAMIGFIGAYTTFSTLMLESWRLAEDGALVLAVANVLGSCLLGMLAVVAGLAVGRAMT